MTSTTTPHPATVFDVDVDPEFQAALDYFQANAPQALEPKPQLTPEESRASYRALIDQLCRPLFPDLESKVDLVEKIVPNSTRSVNTRIYTRKEDASKPAPAYILWLHNGGAVEGDLDCEHLVALHHCIRTGHRIVYIDYSKAPEHKFPACIDDSEETLQWMRTHAKDLNVESGAPLYVWGSSQGGTIASALAMREAKAGKTDSWKRTMGRFNTLEPEQMRNYTRNWLVDPSQATSNPEVTSLQAKDIPSNVAPFHFIRCSLDPLDDDADLYEKRLQQAGVSTSHTELGALPHVFYILGVLFPKALNRLLDDLEKQTSS